MTIRADCYIPLAAIRSPLMTPSASPAPTCPTLPGRILSTAGKVSVGGLSRPTPIASNPTPKCDNDRMALREWRAINLPTDFTKVCCFGRANNQPPPLQLGSLVSAQVTWVTTTGLIAQQFMVAAGTQITTTEYKHRDHTYPTRYLLERLGNGRLTRSAPAPAGLSAVPRCAESRRPAVLSVTPSLGH